MRVRRSRLLLTPGALLDRERHLTETLRQRPALGEAWAVILAELTAPDPGWSRRKDLLRLAESLAWRILTDTAERAGLTRRAAEQQAADTLTVPLDTLRTRARAFR